jgi:glutamine synthetase
VRKLPMNLGEAIERLNANEVIKGALPGEMLRVFNHYKNDEWERFMATVTDWDLRTYIDYLP